MTKQSYYIGIFLNLLLFIPCIILLVIYVMKAEANSPVENYKLAEYGLVIALFAVFYIIYGLIFVIKSKFKVLKKIIYSLLLLAGILPPLYFIFPMLQFTVFRNMTKATN